MERYVRSHSEMVDFSEVNFSNYLSFFDFSGYKFPSGGIDFTLARFNKDFNKDDSNEEDFAIKHVSFSDVDFGDGKVLFSGTRFGDNGVDFSGANFGAGGVVFSRANFFRNERGFNNVNFGDRLVSFGSATFGKDEDKCGLSFNKSIFGREAFLSKKPGFMRMKLVLSTVNLKGMSHFSH